MKALNNGVLLLMPVKIHFLLISIITINEKIFYKNTGPPLCCDGPVLITHTIGTDPYI